MSLGGMAAGAAACWGAYLYIKVRHLPGCATRLPTASRSLIACNPRHVVDTSKPHALQRDMVRNTAETAAALHGTRIVSKVPLRETADGHLVDASRVAMHAKVALISTWNTTVDATFNPVIRELHRRGW